jgi:hypothetical protein
MSLKECGHLLSVRAAPLLRRDRTIRSVTHTLSGPIGILGISVVVQQIAFDHEHKDNPGSDCLTDAVRGSSRSLTDKNGKHCENTASNE